jgi:hypothetical protein
LTLLRAYYRQLQFAFTSSAVVNMRLDLLIAAAGLLGTTAGKPSKFVNEKDLIKDIKLKNLIKGSEKLQRIADKYGGNRAFGGGGVCYPRS